MAGPAAHGNDLIPPMANRKRPVGNAVPGVPRSSTPFPTRPKANPQAPFLPPAGKGGIRRSPARRMTEEGESYRLQTVYSVRRSPQLRSFTVAVPLRSPSPAALVGGTLPRWGRERERALWRTSNARRIRNAPCTCGCFLGRNAAQERRVETGKMSIFCGKLP